jgi:protease-4
MRQYLVASAADRIIAHPTVALVLTGVAAQVVFLRQLLDKLGVAFDILKIGEYKSAPETFTRTSSSEPARRQLEVFVGDVTDRFVAAVAASRKRSEVEVRALFDRPAIPAVEARSEKWIDEIAHPDRLEDEVKALFGRKIDLTQRSTRPVRASQWAFPEIAVIHIDGDITPGPSTPGLFGAAITGDDIAKAIKEARESSSIRAIVLRINSPGGAVQPSERIAREVELTRGKKPIIVSMADLAASGGYMAAAHGDTIYAAPSTLTGSIGIFSIKLSADRLLARLGVSVETVKVGQHADAGSAFRKWNAAERQAQEKVMRYLYGRFVALVAKGRKLSPEKVDELGRGRIWSGTRAQTVGLVDRSGGFLAAFDEARRRTGLPSRTEVRAVQLPVKAGGLFNQLLGIRSARDVVAASLPPAIIRGLEKLPAVLLHGSGQLARLEWVVE